MSLLPSMPAGKDMQEDKRACDACAPQSCLQDVGCPRAVPAPCVAENCLEESRTGAEDCVKRRMKHNIMLFCMLGVCQGSSLFRWGCGGISAELEVMGSMGRASFAGCYVNLAACLRTKLSCIGANQHLNPLLH